VSDIDLLVECEHCGAPPHKPCAEDDGIGGWFDVPSHQARLVDARCAERDLLTADNESLRREVEHAKEFIAASKECADAITMLELQEDNDRFRAAFRQLVERIEDEPGATVRSVFCSWCNERWPKLDGESVEAAKEYARRHASVCKTHPLRVERDAAITDRDALRATVERMRPVVDVARRVVSRGIHRRNNYRDIMLREVMLLPNDIEILGQLAAAIDAAEQGERK
jgi:hypothetical protein